MLIYPAIDIYEGKAVRLIKGDYNQMTVYSTNPVEFACDFAAMGATHLHMVDLEGARSGQTPNAELIAAVAAQSGLFVEVGGGIRSMDAVRTYLDAGVDRVIIGTAAVKDPEFLTAALSEYGARIAVGVDIADGMVAIKGWTEKSDLCLSAFCARLQEQGVRTIICTDISKDGMLAGTNRELYRQLSRETHMDIIASGGVSSLEDVAALRDLGLHGAIIGKAYYEKYLDLAQALACAHELD